jgi:hypothetical protein
MRRSTLVYVAIGSGLLLGLAFVGQHAIFGATDQGTLQSPAAPSKIVDSPRATTSPSAEDSRPAVRYEKLSVIEARSLERLEGGEWVAIEAGETLSATDRIRTNGFGVVKLETGDGSRIELVDEVEVSVEALTKSLAELELHRGRLRADVASGSDAAIRVTSSGATAEAQAGAFVVFADGAGMVAVASETADVTLRAQEREVTVEAGQQALVRPESPPTDPEAIPEEVFLKVAWPSKRTRRERRLVVRGRVDPGTEVRIGDRIATVGSDGSFSTPVDLREGRNDVIVKARDIGGRTKTDSTKVIVKNRPPRLELISPGGWDGGE